ncbi:MAG: ATP phosphoribosyltransferase [Alphaproteobacteria bacterium]
MTAPLILAVPSKGRLKADSSAFLSAIGVEIAATGGSRSYRGRVTGVPGIDVVFLSAPEIAREVGMGAVHVGVTGRDQIEETVPDWSARAELIAPMGFGHCDVVVAVPDAWIDVDTMDDLDDVAGEFRPRHGRRLTVATKYVNTTRRYFAQHGIADYRIVESLGATEGAPASGAADLIVDITSSGSTLRANGLKILSDGVILRSEAYLAMSLAAAWNGKQKKALQALVERLGDRGLYARLAQRAGFSEAAGKRRAPARPRRGKSTRRGGR